MFLETVLPLLAVAQLIGGSPLNSSVSDHVRVHVERAVCELKSMEIDVTRFDCPRKFQLNSEGHCKDGIPDTSVTTLGVPFRDQCTAYCEIRITPHWGQEVPFNVGSCLDGDECVVTKGTTISYTRTWEVSVGFSIGIRSPSLEGEDVDIKERQSLEARGEGGKGLAATFEAGASLSFSKTVAYTESMGQNEKINATHCGYWTFVPRLVESCGTLTRAQPKPVFMKGVEQTATCNKNKLESKGNWCNTAPYMLNGQADGAAIFVLVDCGSNKLLPMKQQPKPYQYPGVSTGPPSGTKMIRRFVS